jgi:hypothetical protein
VHGMHWGEIWPLLQESNEKLWKYPVPMLSMRYPSMRYRHQIIGTKVLFCLQLNLHCNMLQFTPSGIRIFLVPHPWSPPATSLECLCKTENNLLSKFVIRKKTSQQASILSLPTLCSAIFLRLGNLILCLPDSTEKHGLEDQPNWVLTVGLSLASNVILWG